MMRIFLRSPTRKQGMSLSLACASGSVLVFALMSFAPAAPVPTHLMKEPVYFHPTKVGTKWVFCHGKSELFTKMIVESKRCDDGRAITIELDNGACKEKIRYLITGTAIYLVASGNVRYSPPTPLFQVTHDESWTSTSRVTSEGGGAVLTRRSTVRESGVLKVAAGSFEATRIDVRNVEEGPGVFTHSTWYAKGIGEVKSGMEDFGHFIELKSFTPGKD